MEKSLTTVGRIHRQFAAGRPPKEGAWESRSALRIIARRTDELVTAMKEAKLNPADMDAWIVCGKLADKGPLNTEHLNVHVTITTEQLARKGVSRVLEIADNILMDPAKVVIGTVYSIFDRELPEPKYRVWANPVYRDVDGEAEIALAAVLKRMEVTGKPPGPGDYAA